MGEKVVLLYKSGSLIYMAALATYRQLSAGVANSIIPSRKLPQEISTEEN